MSILLKTAFWQTSIHSQSLVKILSRSDKDKISFKAIEKYRYGLEKTVSKHLNWYIFKISLNYKYLMKEYVKENAWTWKAKLLHNCLILRLIKV